MTGALLTDSYELTMAASYYKHGLNGTATFDLFVRELPANRNFLVVAGIEAALDRLGDFAVRDRGRRLPPFPEPLRGCLPRAPTGSPIHRRGVGDAGGRLLRRSSPC